MPPSVFASAVMIGLLRYNDQSLSLTCEALLTRIVAMAGKEAEKRLHETDDESTAPFEHQQKVKSKKYMQKWKDEYYKLENMEKSTKGPHFAHCGVCHRDFSISHGGRNDCSYIGIEFLTFVLTCTNQYYFFFSVKYGPVESKCIHFESKSWQNKSSHIFLE